MILFFVVSSGLDLTLVCREEHESVRAILYACDRVYDIATVWCLNPEMSTRRKVQKILDLIGLNPQDIDPVYDGYFLVEELAFLVKSAMNAVPKE